MGWVITQLLRKTKLPDFCQDYLAFLTNLSIEFGSLFEIYSGSTVIVAPEPKVFTKLLSTALTDFFHTISKFMNVRIFVVIEINIKAPKLFGLQVKMSNQVWPCCNKKSVVPTDLKNEIS